MDYVSGLRTCGRPVLGFGDGRKCPVCGTRFWPTEEWGCRHAGRPVCSIPCMRKLEREELAEEAARRKRTKQWAVYTAYMRGETISQIAARTGANPGTVKNLIEAARNMPTELLRMMEGET